MSVSPSWPDAYSAPERMGGPDSLVALDHIPHLDGIRGFAAFWVLLGHVQIVSGMWAVPLLSYGRLAVDLFMMMSGFLMAHHYMLRRQREPWQSPATWIRFWSRRVFRIAPLYYLLLLAGFLVGPILGDYLGVLERQWPQIGIRTSHYTDRDIGNILAHLSFVFGSIPAYHHETPLPDWSIGLEMGFYAAFPFLMLVISRMGTAVAAIGLVSASLALGLMLSDYFNQFEMPSLLPMKLYVFLSGMLIAVGRWHGSMRASLALSVAFSLVYLLREESAQAAARVVMVVLVFYLMNDGSLPSWPTLDSALDRMRRVLGGEVARLMGETSYAVYLLHFLIIIPVTLFLSKLSGFTELAGSIRFVVCFLVSAPIVYVASWGLHLWVERPGIRLGKMMVNRLS